MKTWYSVYVTASGAVRVVNRGTDERNDLRTPVPPPARPNQDSAFYYKMSRRDVERALSAGPFKEMAEMNPRRQLLVGLDDNHAYSAWIVERDDPRLS